MSKGSSWQWLVGSVALRRNHSAFQVSSEKLISHGIVEIQGLINSKESINKGFGDKTFAAL
jgi:hypothetical protein